MTTKVGLWPDDLELLQEVLRSRAPERLEKFIQSVQTATLASSERVELCEIIGAEFAATGLDGNSEPTPRGYKLERLLDIINHPGITQK